MKLKTLTTINWSNVPNRTYEFANVNLFSGGSGAGKTTLLDALQTVLSAAMRSIYQFNPAQDEVKQSSRKKRGRSLESYALGGDQQDFSRKESITYIAATFSPEASEPSEVFTAIVAVKAHLNEIKKSSGGKEFHPKLDDQKLFLIHGQEINKSHFIKGNSQIIAPEELSSHFKSKFAISLPKPLEKKAYLSALYGAFHGSGPLPSQDAQRSAKGLLKCMSYKPLESIDAFAKSEVMEAPKGLDELIYQVRSMIRDIHTLKLEADKVKASLHTVTNAKANLRKWINLICNGKIQSYLESVHAYQKIHKQLADTEDELSSIEEEKDYVTQSGHDLDAKLSEIQNKLAEVSSEIRGDVNLATKEDSKKQLSKLKQNVASAFTSIQSELNAIRGWKVNINSTLNTLANSDLPNEISALLDELGIVTKDFPEVISGSDLNSAGNLSDHVLSTFSLYEDKINEIRRLIESNYDEILQFYSLASAELNEKKAKLAEVNHALSENSNASLNLPADITQAVNYLSNNMPDDADVALLCSFIDVKEPEWQWAIEAFLGRDRFAILVKPGYEVQAQKLLRSAGHSNTQVLQTSKLFEFKAKLSPNNLAELITSTATVATKYIEYKLGNIERVENEEDLASVSRGIMKDGRAAMGFKIFQLRLHNGQMVLGETARKARYDYLCEQQELLAKEVEAKGRVFDGASNFRSLLKWNTPLTIVDESKNLKSDLLSIDELEKAIQTEDSESDKALLDKQKSLKLEQENCNKELVQNAQKIGSYNKRIEQLSEIISALRVKLSDAKYDQETAFANIQHIDVAVEPDYFDKIQDWCLALQGKTVKSVFPSYLEPVEYYAKSHDLSGLVDSSINSFNENESQLPIKQSLSSEHLEYVNRIGDRKGNVYAIEFPVKLLESMLSLELDLEKRIDVLENHILNKKLSELHTMEDQFKKTFVSDLCIHVFGQIKEGQQYLSMLNSKLKGYFFGGDTFQFDYKIQPSMKSYYEFFSTIDQAVNYLREIGELEDYLSTYGQDALVTYEELKNSLLDEDEERAYRTLSKLMDYREYFLVDIFKYRKLDNGEMSSAISLEEDATGSGGQLETPAYVIRSASLVGALGCDKEESSLKLMMVDEAFNKSDDERVKAIIRYLSETLGFQLLIAMPTRSTPSLLSEFDKVFSVSKLPSTRSPIGTETYINEKLLNRDAIQELWETTKVNIENKTAASFMDYIAKN